MKSLCVAVLTLLILRRLHTGLGGEGGGSVATAESWDQWDGRSDGEPHLADLLLKCAF